MLIEILLKEIYAYFYKTGLQLKAYLLIKKKKKVKQL